MSKKRDYEIPEWLVDFEISSESLKEAQSWEPSSRDLALFSLGEIDFDAQLIAIKGVLQRNRSLATEVSRDIRSLGEEMKKYAGDDEEYRIHIENYWVDVLHDTVFQDAAHSMSAVGLIAPFLESLIEAIFRGLRKRFANEDYHISCSERGDSRVNNFWNAQLVRTDDGWRKEGRVKGTEQILTAIGLRPFIPNDFGSVYAAVTAYRNRMFHNGFEWPLAKRKQFDELILSEGWPPNWFKASKSGGEPWIFYMSDDFVSHCLLTIDLVLEGLGLFLKERSA